MNDIDELWYFLEKISTQDAVLVEWQSLLGSSFNVVKNFFLKRSGQESITFPCPQQTGENCPRKIVLHSDDDIVAVCGNYPPECETISLKKSDLDVYHLHLESIARQIARACGFAGAAGNKIDGASWIYSLGMYTPVAGPQSPAYFVVPDMRDNYELSVRHLLSIHQKETPLLFVPTGKYLTAEDRRVADPRVLGCISCDQILAWDDASRKIVATTSVNRVLAGIATGSEPVTPVLPDKYACFTDASSKVVLISSDEDVERLRLNKATSDHYVDATTPNRITEKRVGKKRDSGKLKPTEVTMLIAYLLRWQGRDEPIEPGLIRLETPSTPGSRGQAFKELRRIIDTNGVDENQARLFKSHAAVRGKAKRFMFEPDSDIKFTFIFPVGLFQSVRNQLKK